MVLTDPMILQPPFLGEGPKALQAVDVTSSFGEFYAMIDGQVLPIELRRLLGLEPIGVEDAPLFRTMLDLSQQGFGRDIVHNSGEYPSLALQHAKDFHFPSRTISSNSFAFTTKVTLIALDLTRQFLKLLAQMLHDFLAVLHVLAANLGITPSKFPGGFVGRNLKAEVVQGLKVIIKFLRTVLASTASVFESVVSQTVKTGIATNKAYISVDSSMNNFQHNQASFRLGPEHY